MKYRNLDKAIGVAILLTALVLFVVFFCGCPTQPHVQTPLVDVVDVPPHLYGVDATDANVSIPSVCVAACANLLAYGCPEALGVDGGESCVVVCAKASTGVFNIHPELIADAGSLQDLRAIGSVKCEHR